MGGFDRFTYSGGRWTEGSAEEPYLSIEIHDSDFATVDFAPTHGSTGRFYVGFEPRHYFEEETASAPVDRDVVAAALGAWAETNLGVAVAPQILEAFFADADGDDPEDDFVEDTVAAFLEALGLPAPAQLSEG